MMELRIEMVEAAQEPNLGCDRTSTTSSINRWSEVKLCSDPKQLIAEKHK